MDGGGEEPVQEWRPLLGQRLCHAHIRRQPDHRLRVGADQTQHRAGAPRRSPLPAPECRQVGHPHPRPLVAGAAGLAAVHPHQPGRLPHRRLAELPLGLPARRPALHPPGPDRPGLAEPRHQTPAAAGRADHLGPADRADVYRQPRCAGTPGNGHAQPGSPPEDLPDPPAGYSRAPYPAGTPGRHPGPQQFRRAGTPARGDRAGGRRRQPDGGHHSGGGQPCPAHRRRYPGSQSPDQPGSADRRRNP
ncbi:hypothetical protein D3C76_1079640 [compost metagenome]